MAQWSRIGNEYVFEMSTRDKRGEQITLLSSWHNIVAIIKHKEHILVRTQKHYSYNVTDAIDKMLKKHKYKRDVKLCDRLFYSYLCDLFGVDKVQHTPDGDVKFFEEEDYDDEG